MKLQILIPQYKETEDTIKNLLDSIAIQQNIDFNDIGVIIVNDGTDVNLSEEFLSQYDKLNIHYYLNNHVGVSGTRNVCLQLATADYIMYCDADDMFSDVRAIMGIFENIEATNFDVLVSAFYQETLDEKTNRMFYLPRGADAANMDGTFVHGKIYRREYLIDNQITWNVNLTIHEDSYFNCLAIKLCDLDKLRFCPTPFYIWKHNPNSVSRESKNYIQETYTKMLDSNEALVEQFIIRGKVNLAEEYLCGMIYQAYYELNYNERWELEYNKNNKNITEQRFAQYYKKFQILFENIDDSYKAEVLLRCKKENYTDKKPMSFSQWINMILGKIN